MSSPDPVDASILGLVSTIVGDVKEKGKEALLEYAIKFGDIQEGQDLVITREQMKEAYDALPEVRISLTAGASRNASAGRYTSANVCISTKRLNRGRDSEH